MRSLAPWLPSESLGEGGKEMTTGERENEIEPEKETEHEKMEGLGERT